jgi:hypothetical protein
MQWKKWTLLIIPSRQPLFLNKMVVSSTVAEPHHFNAALSKIFNAAPALSTFLLYRMPPFFKAKKLTINRFGAGAVGAGTAQAPQHWRHQGETQSIQK